MTETRKVPPAETNKQYFRVDSREISFFRFILEGYDGMAVLTTLDASCGGVALAIAPGCEQDVADIISGLKSEMLIEPAPASELINAIKGSGARKNDQDDFFRYPNDLNALDGD